MTATTDGAPRAGNVKPMESHHQEGGWELFAHDADIGVRGFGKSRDKAFEEAAYALSAAITDLSSIKSQQTIDIVCTAINDELLLSEWLNAVVYEMATRDMLFCRYSVQIHDHGLIGKAWGEEIDVERHQPAAEVKGATMTELHVARDSDGYWLAQCVVDV
jgi:tRNA nucleotidyltransferase (CCA-adding enzyme)